MTSAKHRAAVLWIAAPSHSFRQPSEIEHIPLTPLRRPDEKLVLRS